MDKVLGIVTFARPWAMEDEKTGLMRKGLSVEFFLTDKLDPIENEDGSVGYKYTKDSLPIDKHAKLKEVPGIYEFTFTLASGAKGKLQTKLSDITFVSSI